MSLLPLDPFSQRQPLPVSPTERTSIISIISSYYEFLARLPHIDSSWLCHPPETGWSGINEEVLRARNRTPEAIDLLKHLPYFQRTVTSPAAGLPKDKSVLLTPDALSIAYHVGETWDGAVHMQCPTPGNVVWLAKMDRWDGTALLLDVDTGTITEFSFQSRGPPLLPMEDRNALAPEDRWMSHPTWSVSTYIREARRHYERLVWIPIPGASFATGSWDIMMRVGDEIMDELAEEDDMDFIHNDDDDDDDNDEDYDEENDVSMVSMDDHDDKDQNVGAYDALDLGTVSQEEVAVLIEEAGSNGTVFSDQSAARVLSRSVRVIPLDQDTSERTKLVKRKWFESIAIYRRNRWPHNDFDGESCTRDLLEWRDMAEKRQREEYLSIMRAKKKT